MVTPWRRPSYDIQAVLTRLNLMEDRLDKPEKVEARVGYMEKRMKGFDKLLHKQANKIMVGGK